MPDLESEHDAPIRGSSSPIKPPANCALIGPSGAGKTNFALACVHACVLPPVDGFQIRVRHAEGAEALFRRAAVFTPHERPLATVALEEYKFEVDVAAEETWRSEAMSRLVNLAPRLFGRFEPPQPATACFKVIDGPGGDLFPNPGKSPDRDVRESLIREAQTAQSLVICVNASSGQSQTVRSELPLILSQLSGPDGSLRFGKILLLLTQVDRLASQFLDVVRQRSPTLNGSATWAIRYFAEHPQVTARTVCESIDPLSLARDLLQDRVLHNLWTMTGMGRKLGIGVCSAWGFDGTTGAPFFDEYSDSVPLLDTANWTPFGIREALYFLLNPEPARDRFIGPIREFAKDRRCTLPISGENELKLEVDH